MKLQLLQSIFKLYLNLERMGKKSLEQVVQENIQMGFDVEIIKLAYENAKGDADKVLQQIFKLQQLSSQYPTKPATAHDQDAQLSKAIQLSINEAKDKKISLEPLNPEQRVRKSGVPVGLKNIGNTCYFNSLLQTYFQNVQFVRSVLNYQTPQKYKKDKKPTEGEQQIEFKRKQASCKLVENLKILFGNMIASDRRYVDPTDVISSVVDDYGNQIPIGDQKDIGEFNLVFLSRIDEGLTLNKKQHEMVEQNQKMQKKEDSPSKIAVFGDDSNSQFRMTHRSSIKIEQDSVINHQFIGTMENSYTNQPQNIHKSEDEQFSLLFVNVKNNQLYKALQQITIQHIDDYRNDKGEVVGVEKQSWIKKAPTTLFFQIDRVVFDKQAGQLKKINDEFDFPLTFFIDPFLLKNKDKALAVQKNVRKLRQQRQKYTNALKMLQKFGQKNVNLLQVFHSTIDFLKHQKNSMESENQTQNPTVFPALAPKIKPEHVSLLQNYSNQIGKRIEGYEQKIKNIQKEIEKCYSEMRSTTPYHLYSILIHEGSADSGHYYSYTYDIKSKVWRKYNDINISEEIQNQVVKQAKGINFTSAYYLVYAQQEALVSKSHQLPLRNHQLANGDSYMKDYYSSMIPNDLKHRIRAQNQSLYLEIQQFKMGAFANRVIDSYTKKFQTCNESFRKAKWQKKKNGPPLLTNLPLYFKSLGLDQSYKNSLLANSVQQYGPKEINPVFQDLIKKKVTNFNDFKKPKSHIFDQKHAQNFMKSIYKARAATKLFQSLKNEQYKGVFGLIKQLKSGQPNEYFDWLINLVGKILMVAFLAEAEVYLEKKQYNSVLERLRLMLVLGLNFINRQQQKALISNCFYWATEISIGLPQDLKSEVETITQLLNSQGKQSPYDQLFLSQNACNVIQQMKNSTDIQDALWNLSRSQNTYIDSLLHSREEVKGKMQVANDMYREMKKKNVPLTKGQREQVIKRLSK